MVPAERIQACNEAPVATQARYVLYWMTAFRRLEWNYSLQRAIEWCNQLHKPLVIFEPLRIDYRWANQRLHRFVVDGMAEHYRALTIAQRRGVLYYPYIEPEPRADNGLLAALADDACVVITDDYPAFFLPRMLMQSAQKLPVRIERIDANGLYPMRHTERIFTTAFSFRAHLQKVLPAFIEDSPQAKPLQKLGSRDMPEVAAKVLQRWPMASEEFFDKDASGLAQLPIDHSVPQVSYRGGLKRGRKRLKEFLDDKLSAYIEYGNDPDADARSELSPYLHFGHLSVHEAFHELMAREGWSPASISSPRGGKKEGWWNTSPETEAWLDELITWRELGYNMACHSSAVAQYRSLPDWARATLDKHDRDPRAHEYTLDEFARAETHDPLWNAAQRQLLIDGRIHNYLRMLWGKKILEWSASPRDALKIMIELNNRYAVDGRDPNSYSGIFWVLGRYDRPWGPERPIFGTVRYMSSDSTRKKYNVSQYLARWSGA